MDIAADSPLPAALDSYFFGRVMAPSSRQQMEIAVRSFWWFSAAYYGRPPIVADLTRDGVHAWLDALAADGRKNATINSKRSAILALWNFCADEIELRPPRRVKRWKRAADEPVGWTAEQFASLLQATDRMRGTWYGVPASLCWRFALLVCYDTACRFGELWHARAEAVDLDSGRWTVPAEHTKTGQGRTYALHPDTCAAIAATLDAPRVRLWPFPCRRRQVWVHFDRLLCLADLPRGRKRKWHCLRRTAESLAAKQRGTAWAAEAVGHTEQVAKRHYLVPDLYEAPRLIDALPRPDPAPALSIFAG